MNSSSDRVARCGGNGFIEGASFVGHFIECGLLDHELVRSHLVKALTHHYPRPVEPVGIVRTNAISRLFVVAGNTLLQGLLEPEDVRTCFEILENRLSRPGGIAGLSTTKLEVWCVAHPNTPHQNLLTRVTRNFASFMPRGCNGKANQSKGMSRRLKNAREKRVRWLLKSLQR